jgi:hypothetical protein
MDIQEIERLSIPEPNSGCWLWLGNIGGIPRYPYGVFYCRGTKTVYAHRLSYELHKGPIPEGLEIDHLCRNPLCVNPDHLEAVTHAENLRRGVFPKGKNHHKGKVTHCPMGHEYREENTYTDKHGKRSCLTCKAIRRRR